jgi:hypothetical protein
MNEQIIELLKAGYDIQFNSLRTKTGLHHPQAATHMEIILMRRVPGMVRKGGSCFAKGKIPWDMINDPKAMEYILNNLQEKVDRIHKREEANNG